MSSRISVVFVEDDERLARLTAQYLANHQVDVTTVARGDLALAEVARVQPDVILLDLMLPGVDGITLCRRLRERVNTPIIMVTARTEEADRVLGLEGGADDYVAKPFSSRELLARIRAQARRASGKSGPGPERIVVQDIVIDMAALVVTRGGRPIALTSSEFYVLKALAERAGRVLGREQLLELVHGNAEETFDRAVDVAISRLRQKLGDDPRNPQLLKTVRGMGYMMAAQREGLSS